MGERENQEERAAFAVAFRRLRDSTRETVATAAEAFGVSEASIWAWAAPGGRSRPRAGWRKVLADMARKGLSELDRERATLAALMEELDLGAAGEP